MMIQYQIEGNGGFRCGDVSTGKTAYAYPSSPSAIAAKRTAARVARDMLERQSDARLPGYDEMNWYLMKNGPLSPCVASSGVCEPRKPKKVKA